MRILRSADYKRMPWKNGKGETVEVAVFPPDASVSDFDWRISMATVAEDGDFSSFSDIDRTLSVLSGAGVVLSVEGAEDVSLIHSSAPYSFPGDRPTSAKLLDGPITDLNVMTRRGSFRHTVEMIAAPSMLKPAEGPMFFLCHHGAVEVSDGGRSEILQALDCAILDSGQSLELAGSGHGFLIGFWPTTGT